MAASRRNTSQRLTLVILLLASITVITVAYKGEARRAISSVRNGAADAIAPVQRGVAAVLHPIGNLFAGMADYGGALGENQRLQLEVGQLRRQLIEAGQAQQQLDQLRLDQNLPFADGIPEVLGEVISSPSSNFDLTIEIDRGTSDGVGAGMPVVSGAGLVGSVISAGRHTAIVQLLTDPRSEVGVRFGTGNVAVAVGQGEGDPLQLQYVSETSATSRGAAVVTSGLDVAAYPSGIPVGTVSSVHHAGGSLTSQVLVTPLVNLLVLQYVAVLQWFPPA
ncbi:MAG: rod shape-determining protein MreC [Acidimicrobiales bacterium]